MLALADVARLSGHPREAVAPLERILTDFAHDPQAPLAAFALGRLELDALDRPRAAAAALESALALGVPRSLREDVRARLVEAHERAGDGEGARAAARAYVRELPSGRHRAEMETVLAAALVSWDGRVPRGVLIAVVCLGTAPARAADVSVVADLRVRGPSCPITPLSVPAFVDSLRVELAGRARQPGTTLVTLSIEPCDAATARVHVAVTSDARATADGRDVALEDIAPDARPRALALAVAELVRGAEAALPPPPVVTPPAVSPPPTPPHTSSTSVAADALFELFPGRDTALWGGRVSLSLDRPRWSFAFFGEAAVGEHDYDVGEVALRTLGGGASVGPRFAGAPPHARTGARRRRSRGPTSRGTPASPTSRRAAARG